MKLKIKKEFTGSDLNSINSFVLKLVKDPRYGNYAAVIEHDKINKKFARAGGCGYCKRSDAFKQLFSKILEDGTDNEKFLNKIDSGILFGAFGGNYLYNLKDYGLNIKYFEKGKGASEKIYFVIDNQ